MELVLDDIVLQALSQRRRIASALKAAHSLPDTIFLFLPPTINSGHNFFSQHHARFIRKFDGTGPSSQLLNTLHSRGSFPLGFIFSFKRPAVAALISLVVSKFWRVIKITAG